MKLTLKIDPERMTLNDLVMLETGKLASAVALRQFVSRFVTGPGGEFVDNETALAQAGELTLSELRAVMEQLGETVTNLQEAAVPPASGGV